MSSPSVVDFYKSLANWSTIYGGFFVFGFGMIGNILNIIVFTSLNTFRETSAALYMTVTSGVNIVQLIVSLLSRILITGFNMDPTRSSLFVCKTREYLVTTLMLISFTLMCFAVIDQFFSMTVRWHHLCNTRVARRLTLAAFVANFLHNIPCSLYYDHVISSSTGQISCGITNRYFSLYYSRFLFPILLGFLPLLIRITFGLLAFINVRGLRNGNTPVVRVERDKQLTVMVGKLGRRGQVAICQSECSLGIGRSRRGCYSHRAIQHSQSFVFE